MIKNDKFELTEKQKERLYCVFIVIIIVVVAFGDQIILNFIQHHPNPNDRVFGENVQDLEYTISFLQELTVEEIVHKINNKDVFLLLSTRDTCDTCVSIVNDLEEYLNQNQINIYYVNRENIDINSEIYQEWIMMDKSLEVNLSYTPYLMYYKDGNLEDSLVGKTTKEDLEIFLLKNKW